MSEIKVRYFYDIPEKMLAANLDKYSVKCWCVEKNDKVYVFKKEDDAKIFLSGGVTEDKINEVKILLNDLIRRRVFLKNKCKKIENDYEEACFRLDRKDWTVLGYKYGLNLEMYEKLNSEIKYGCTSMLGKKNLKILLRTCKKIEIKKIKVLLSQTRDKIRIYTDRLEKMKLIPQQAIGEGPWKVFHADEL